MGYEIAIINPRSTPKRRKTRGRKKGAKVMAARKKRRKMSALQRKYFGKRRARKVTRRKTARRANPRKVTRRKRRASGYVVGSGPIRRRKLNPRKARRVSRRRRSNPRFSLSGITSQLKPAVYGAGGALALDLAMGYIPLPEMLRTGYARHATRIVGALGVGFLAAKFLGSKGQDMGRGALTVAMYGLVKDVALKFAPPAIATRLGDYEEVSVDGYMDPAPVLGAYMNGGNDLGAYMNGSPEYSVDPMAGADF